MDNEIDQLKIEVDEIKKWLNELKDNVSLSETERKNKAEDLKSQAEVTKQKIENEIRSLENKTDNESKKKKEEAEALLNNFNDTTKLYTSIINTWSINTPNETAQPEPENKGVFSKTKDWIWEQWNDIRSKEKWQKEWWKNLLRTAWFVCTWVWTIALAYKWLKKLFWWWKEEGSNKSESSDKKNSFRDSGRWKFLTWTGIATATWWWIYGLTKLHWWKRESQAEHTQECWDTVSEDMFQQLLKIEGSQDFIAKTHKKKFWEDFATWPYGMVYKHIDENWNLLKKPIPFEDGEQVSEDWAQKNARALYDKRAKERKDLLDAKWYKYNQDMLDSLVSTCWWTSKARKSFKDYVLSHRNNKNEVVDFISKHATTAAGNGQTMPGLVRRRKFEANWFIGNKQPYKSYKA